MSTTPAEPQPWEKLVSSFWFTAEPVQDATVQPGSQSSHI
jgi:hypothetical protein